MLDEQQLVSLPNGLQDIFKKLEQEFIDRICEHIGEIGSLNATDLHRLYELSRIGFDVAAMEKDIASVLKISERDVRKTLYNAAEQEYDGVVYDMMKIHRNVVLFAENERLQTLIDSISKATSGEIKNISKTLGFVNSRNEKGIQLTKSKWEDLSTYYQNAVDYAVLQIRTGQVDFYSAMRSTINTMSDYGLSYVEYESGYIRRLDTSVRSAILGGQARLSQAQAELVGEQIGADGYEITWHSGFRPTHTFGGTQFSLKAFEDEGIRDLMDEPNCYHRKFPVVIGVSTPTYSKLELRDLNEAEKETHIWRGNSYDKYDSTQIQRRYETAIRQYKDRANANESAATETLKEKNPEAYKAFKDAATAAKGKVTAINQEYAEFSKTMGLYTQPKRATVSGYTRGESQKTIEKNLQKWYNNSINIDDAQFGKKIGKHAKDYGLSAGNKNDREKMKDIINDIVKNKNEIRRGMWRGQGEKNESGNKTEGIVDFLIKGDDVVVAKEGEFISILKDGINNPRVKKANRVKE